MSDRKPTYPGYHVLAKRDTPSWNDATRRVIDARLATPREPRFLARPRWDVADALCRRILPQDGEQEPVLLVAMLDAKLFDDAGGGFREADMPYMREAWQTGLDALDAESRARHPDRGFAALEDAAKDELITLMQRGLLDGQRWNGMDSRKFFERRILVDVPALYYSQPGAWDEIGFGGPASPRGYVRLDGDRLDPWEAVAAAPGNEADAEQANSRVV